MRRLSGALLAVLSLLAVGLVESAPVVAVPVAVPAAVTGSSTSSALIGTRVIGHTVKGRRIKAYHLGDPTSPVKAVFVATIHGNEAQPARILLNLRNGAPIAGADIWVVPYLNRDGFTRHTRKNAHGVDLNRNFPVRWIRQHGSYDSGRKPASEPETRALMRFLRAVRPSYVAGFHQPLNGVDTSYGKSRPLAYRLSANLHLPRKVFSCNHGCHGTMTQWFNKRFPGAALTVEYGAHMTRHQKYVIGPTGLLASIGATR
jgi:predicted deacylase